MCDEAQPLRVEAEPVRANPQERRSFLRLVTGAIIALVTLPASLARAKKVGLSISKIAELQKVGGSRILTVKETKLLVVRDSDSTVKALNPMCTHKSCEVQYRPSSNDLGCKCHKSAFKLDGSVMGGPAKKPLQTYEASLNGEQIVISLP